MLQKLITIQSFAMLSVLASILVTFNNCTTTTNTFEDIEHLQIQSEEIDRLIQLPLNCIEQEWPNKLNQTLDNANEIGTPAELHPVFWAVSTGTHRYMHTGQWFVYGQC
ncbi:MAG: DUF2891 family protein [Prolixibacteraceae bacterium]|jgi:hypothetical protein|nr:DUF2891 family protein [Prolixibacteraceae bacterium]